jgi:hypothetical protein
VISSFVVFRSWFVYRGIEKGWGFDMILMISWSRSYNWSIMVLFSLKITDLMAIMMGFRRTSCLFLGSAD